MVIDGEKRSKALSEVKSVENIDRNLQSFLEISSVQKESFLEISSVQKEVLVLQSFWIKGR